MQKKKCRRKMSFRTSSFLFMLVVFVVFGFIVFTLASNVEDRDVIRMWKAEKHFGNDRTENQPDAAANMHVKGGMLYPRDSESRETKELNGMWNFRTSGDDQAAGFREQWYKQPLSFTGSVIPMPVPASYNDITEDKAIRDYIGWVWYDKDFFVPSSWLVSKRRVVLRFGSAHYYTTVWLNGAEVMTHVGGHLPFEAEVSDFVQFGMQNRVTVAVNNTLTKYTLPQGQVQFKNDTKRYPKGYHVQLLNFDFFNYAGIHRTVLLYTTPPIYIDDITLTTDVQGTTGLVTFSISVIGQTTGCEVVIRDKQGKAAGMASTVSGTIKIVSASLWWPFTMHPEPGYMYTFEASCSGQSSEQDVYRLPFGIRTVRVTSTQFLINGKPFYFMGFGKHEDANIRGKGLDYSLIAKDFNLIKWIGANSFRTSHYPYAEEIMDQADQQGIVVIDECPAVGLHEFPNKTLQHHLEVMEELVRRDKNRPSVVTWSIANEPNSGIEAAKSYFKQVADHTRSLDKSRPVTAVLNIQYEKDVVHEFLDFICLNMYYGWYSDTGHTEICAQQVEYDFTQWQATGKACMITEYGADTVAGLHQVPSFIFTEEYQVEFIAEYHKAFDKLRSRGFFIGEMIWNFADFMTMEAVNRVVGNRKGIFTRERQPKASAHFLRKRYHHLVNATLPLPSLF